MKTPLRLLTLMVPIAMLSMVSAGFASVNNTDASESEEPYPYISPTPGEFPIIAWGVNMDTSRVIFKGLVDCGFNAALVIPNKNILKQMMEALNPIPGEDTVKLSIIPYLQGLRSVYTPEATPGYIEYVLTQYQENMRPGNRTSVSGWRLHDEPAFYQFDDWKPYFHSIAQSDPSRMPFINLYGDPRAVSKLAPSNNDKKPSDDLANGQGSYRESAIRSNPAPLRSYITSFCNKFRPGVLSYDYYPFVVDSTAERNDITITETYNRLNDFYTALQLYSEISKKRNRSFWAFCQSKATCVNESDGYKPKDGHPLPTEDFLRYEAFNALAFGAQGIEYWSYKESDIAAEKPDTNVYYALVTKEGKKSPAWYYAQKVNREIKSWTNVFLGAKLDSYYFVGDPQDTTYCDYRRGSSAKAISVMDTNPGDTVGSNRGALVSTLVNGEDNYVVIVNQSPYEPVSLELWLNESEYTIIGLRKSEALPMSNGFPVKPGVSVMRKEDITLAPAQYAIYSYRKKSASGN